MWNMVDTSDLTLHRMLFKNDANCEDFKIHFTKLTQLQNVVPFC